MTIGRIFPIPAPTRVFPVDPTAHGQTGRDAPLPFIIGAGSSTTIETLYSAGFIMQRIITQINTQPQPGGGVSVIQCSPNTNLYCVPQATVIIETRPTATVRCAQ